MASFLILLPFGVFTLLMLVVSATVSLFAAAALSLGIVAWDALRGGAPKMLAVGSVLIFGALGFYIALVDGDWSPAAVRIAIDAGLLAIALLSLAIRLPFTLQYARESVDAATSALPGFVQANYIITWAWTAAFMLMLIANMLTVYAPSLPLWIGLAIAFAARNAAVYFTRWYPDYRRAKYNAAKPAAPLEP